MSDLYALIAQARRGDKKACEQLIQENAGLIWSVARRFLGRGTEADDLYQLGCLGFLKAVEGFDPEYGTQFSTYAVPKISGEIRRFLRDDGVIKVSRTLKEQAASIALAHNRLLQEFGREPTISELSEYVNLTPEEIALAQAATAATESIHKQTGEDGFSLENILTDTESEENMVEKIALRQAVCKLEQRERMVIELRYFHGLTQEKVAKILCVSQVQVSRIEKKSLQKLKQFMD